MVMSKKFRKAFATAAAVALLIAALAGGRAAAADDEPVDRLLPLVGGALVDAGKGEWTNAGEQLQQFKAAWQEAVSSASGAGSDAADEVEAGLAAAEAALAEAGKQPEEAYRAISALAKAVRGYVSAVKPEEDTSAEGKARAAKLLPVLEQALAGAASGDWDEARLRFKQFSNEWGKFESKVRSSDAQAYADIEAKISLARIALQAEPPRKNAAESGLSALIGSVKGYVEGTSAAAVSGENVTIAGLIGLLRQAETALNEGRTDEALSSMQTFVLQWPAAEGAVSTRSQSAYGTIESEMTRASSYLLSSPPDAERAKASVRTLIAALEPYADATSYTSWDAAVILLREGAEALLVVAALLSFLKRTGNLDKAKWVWGGASAGLAVSVALAVVLTYAVAAVYAGTTREMVEGYFGLASVAMMLAVGIWLHGKANAKAWNRYIQKHAGSALSSGRRWSLFAIAGLSVAREGAETAVFYMGMVPSIGLSRLLIGIGAAAAALVALGFVIVLGGSRLPIRPFFALATVLIYSLAFKFLGQSIHSLQIAGQFPSHLLEPAPTVSWLGFYPTWETAVPQLLALVFILLQIVRTRLGNRADEASAA